MDRDEKTRLMLPDAQRALRTEWGKKMIWLIAVGWLICGVLSYGLCKNWWYQDFQKNEYLKYDIKWGKSDEVLCWFIGFCGLAGLIAGVLLIREERYEFRLRYHMPEELCEPEEK